MHRIELPLRISYPTVNAYFTDVPVPTLVDCGMNRPGTIRAIRRALKPHGCGIEDIRKVVITHPHVDHIGLAGVLAGHGAEIWLSDLAADWMDSVGSARRNALDLLLEIMAVHGFGQETIDKTDRFYTSLESAFSAIPRAQRRIFRVGDQVDIGGSLFDVLAAPGHSNRQVCFYQQAEGILFSADMLLPKTPVPLIEPAPDDPHRRDPGLPQLLASYRRFRALDARQVYPGHGKPFTDHRGLIDSQVARIEKRKRQCLELVTGGRGSLPDLLATLYRHLPPNNRLGGLAMLVGYLDLLQAEGLVEPYDQNGIRLYKPV